MGRASLRFASHGRADASGGGGGANQHPLCSIFSIHPGVTRPRFCCRCFWKHLLLQCPRSHFRVSYFLVWRAGESSPQGAGCRSELQRALRAGAAHYIQDAGELRAPAPTKVCFCCVCEDFCEFRGLRLMMLGQFRSQIGNV